jgi:hypothetical protein
VLRRGSFAALLLALALGAASCDNAVCVFGPDGCSNPGGTPGGLGTEAATLPGGGEVVRQGRPTIERILPAESGFAHSRAPVVLEFSESMAPSTVLTAFGVQLLDAC